MVTTGMPSYKGLRYPGEIIDPCELLHFLLSLSFREVVKLMHGRGCL